MTPLLLDCSLPHLFLFNYTQRSLYYKLSLYIAAFVLLRNTMTENKVASILSDRYIQPTMSNKKLSLKVVKR